METQRATSDAGIGVAIGTIGPILVAAALVPFRDEILGANVALVLVTVVVLAAASGGWPAGVAGAIAATLTFDFWFTRPYQSLTIASANDVETAVLLLAVGVSVGFLASWGRRARRVVDVAHSDLRRIHRVAELVAQGAPSTDVLVAAQEELARALALRSCRFEAGAPPSDRARIERNGAVRGHGARHFAGTDLELPREGLDLPVLAGGRPVGRFVLEPTPGTGVSLDQRIVAIAIADQVGAALMSPRTEGQGDG